RHALEIGLVAARSDPGFIRHTRRIGATGNVVATHLDDSKLLILFLLQDVAEDAALLYLVVLPRGPQLVQHAPRHKRRSHNLRGWVVELLTGGAAEILEDADVLETNVTLQVLNPLAAQSQVLLDLAIVGVPEMAVVAGVFDDDFVRSDWPHCVVKSVARAARLAINAVQRMRMDHGARRPRAAVHRRRRRDNLQRLPGLRAERAEVVGRGAAL